MREAGEPWGALPVPRLKSLRRGFQIIDLEIRGFGKAETDLTESKIRANHLHLSRRQFAPKGEPVNPKGLPPSPNPRQRDRVPLESPFARQKCRAGYNFTIIIPHRTRHAQIKKSSSRKVAADSPSSVSRGAALDSQNRRRLAASFPTQGEAFP